ncbi:MAG TPA: hypothetical protein VH415_11115 [Nitrososphaeraceae archaeon]|jgi:hypothetical protein
MTRGISTLRDTKSITVLLLVTVLLSASIASVATIRFDPFPTFFNLGYASKDTSDSEVKQENKAEGGEEKEDENGYDANDEDSDSEVKQENTADANGDEESSDSNSPKQQNNCSNSEVLNEETGKCEESMNDGNTEIQEESIDSSDPDLCLKIDMQIARSTQEERDLITVPPQCLASKTKETDTNQNSEEQIEFPKIKDSSSDTNSDSKKSSSHEDSDESDSKGKSEDSKCLEDSTTAALAALGQIGNQCSVDVSQSSVDKNRETKNTLSTDEQTSFENGYELGFKAVFSNRLSPDNLDLTVQSIFVTPDKYSPALLMGILNGLDAGFATREILAEETKLQKDTLEALGIPTLNFTKLKK